MRNKYLAENVLNLADNLEVSPLTIKKTTSFLNKLIKLDSKKITQFELSFKAKRQLKEKRKIRILNIDSKAYSYFSQKLYTKRINDYYSLIQDNNNPWLARLFRSLLSIADNPLDVYMGADVENNYCLYAFWLIFGGAQKDGKISFVKNSNELINKIFKTLKIKPEFPVSKDILNLGFDIDNSSFFYKIYYFLNKNNYNTISQESRSVVHTIIKFLKNNHKYWFFVSERFEVGKKNINRKKIYLEFLDDLKINQEETYKLLDHLLKIIGCDYKIKKIKSLLKNIKGKIVILAFEDDGTTTFYIRLD